MVFCILKGESVLCALAFFYVYFDSVLVFAAYF